MNTKQSKFLDRKKYKDIRTIEVNKKNDLIFTAVLKTLNKLFPTKESTGFIGIYWPIFGEVDLRPLRDNKKFSLALPSTNNSKEVNYHPWTENSLEKDFYGIPSPIKNKMLDPQEINLLLLPALAMDHEGYRLGYGGGCYDRLRTNRGWKAIKSLIVLPEACISEKSLPRDPWDVPFDGWISEKGTFRIDR